MPIPSWFFPSLFVGFLYLWPLLLFEKFGLPITASALAVNALLASGVWYLTTSKRLSYFAGLHVITLSFMSGCANITALYIVPVLLGIHLLGLYYSVRALGAGRSYSQERWYALANSFHKRRTGQALPGGVA